MIQIDRQKHLALLFRARSGSTVFRSFMSQVLNFKDCSEIFNHGLPERLHLKITDDNDISIEKLDTVSIDIRLSKEYQEKQFEISKQNLDVLSYMTDHGIQGIFGVYHQSYYNYNPELTQMILDRPDVQPLILLRADVLYGIISECVCRETDQYHNTSANSVTRSVNPFAIKLDDLKIHLEYYVNFYKDIQRANPDIPVVYYEQFRQTPVKLLNIFSGLPKKLCSVSTNKWEGDYRKHVTNMDQVENLYREFVLKHIDCFPQLFDPGLQSITPPLPGLQQPSLPLSSLYHAVGQQNILPA